MNTRKMIPLFATAATLCVSTAASAHAFLDHADPRVGAGVDTSPGQVRAWFTQELEPAFSKIQVFDANGTEVDQRDAHLDGGNKSLLLVTIPKLSAGTYKVTWSVVSVDTHRTQGSFSFTVKG